MDVFVPRNVRGACACVCVCVCARARVFMVVCVRATVCVCARARTCVCVCVLLHVAQDDPDRLNQESTRQWYFSIRKRERERKVC
jgi:hypothetical protein